MCTNDLTLNSTIDTVGGTWQWYQAGVALIGETDSIINIMPYGAGDYTAVYTLNGDCEDIQYTVTIPSAPTASFTTANQCDGTAITFTDASTITSGSITNWDWDFGDGNTSTAQNPSNNYTNPGTYNVSLTVTSNSGCTNTMNQNVTVYPNPVSDFEFIINSVSSTTGLTGGCLNDIVNLNDNSTIAAPDNIINYQWDFGDATTSTNQNPTHQYATDGTYTIQLITESNNGCFDTLTMPITMYPSPVAAFTVPGVCLNNTSVFTDASTITSGTINAWEWDFDDSNTSTIQNPTNTYAAYGAYNVELVVTSDQGCTDTTIVVADVYELPQADFLPTGVCDYQLASFADLSTITTGNIASWFWDFGDASGTSTLQNPQYGYGIAGTFPVELLVTSNNGCLDSTTINIDIFGTPTANFGSVNDCYYNLATFVDSSTVSSGAINVWEWDFGDGNTSNLPNPTNQYMADGSYNVQLIVTSGLNCIDTIVKTIIRHPKPNASFNVGDVCQYNPAQFNDLTSINAPGTIGTWAWDFGDFATDNTASPSHLYVAPDTYNVTLTTTSTDGCVDDTTIAVIIYPIPYADFTATTVCENTPPTIYSDNSNISSGAITGWLWSFGNGSTSNIQNPVNNFGVNGIYNSQLIAISDFGCRDTATLPVTVYEKPTANYTSNRVSACNPDCIQFTDLSTSPSANITGWLWDFNNGQSMSEQNPMPCYNHSYDMTVLYDVTLIAENSVGCKDTVYTDDYISIVPTPVASFAFQPQTPDVWNTEVVFTNTSVIADTYYWDFGDGQNTLVEDPVHEYVPEPTSYNVMLVATNTDAGITCEDTTYGFITVDDVIIFYVPNVFTPDGDEYNETFQPVFYSGFDPYDFHLMIFNRWGEVMFESYDATKGWDGTYGDSGLVEDGVYIWTVDFKSTMTDKRNKHKGHVTVLK